MSAMEKITAEHEAPRWQHGLRGRLRANAPLAGTTWFQVGGHADFLFKPEDRDDLALFLKQRPQDLPYYMLGVGSNVIIRDGGLEGVVIKLGRNFTQAELKCQSHALVIGAAMLDIHVASVAADHGVGGLEFLSGIPGTLGGAIKMNAGAYGCDMSDIVQEVELMLPSGEIQLWDNASCGFAYRSSALPDGAIILCATLQGQADSPEAIHERIKEIQKKREDTQPIREKTGGSTFKNPEGHKAWELIDAAGCRGLKHGGAKVSKKHCNFLINADHATAADLEALGEIVREKVFAHSGIELEWEIKRLGTTQRM